MTEQVITQHQPYNTLTYPEKLYAKWGDEDTAYWEGLMAYFQSQELLISWAGDGFVQELVLDQDGIIRPVMKDIVDVAEGMEAF
jgi:hypothetical protein